jgi:type II secretion system protein I
MRLPPRPPARRPRRGLSLLEVIIALAIFLTAVVAISQLIQMGGNRALELHWRNQAARLAQSKMSEVRMGVLPLQSVGDQPFSDEPDEETQKFHWSVDVQANASGAANLFDVVVTVSRERGDGSRLEVKLSQIVYDPTLTGSTQDQTVIGGTGNQNGGGTTGNTNANTGGM